MYKRQAACGHVFKYGDNVDTDVIIPARYLNSSDPKELATHCMEDIDKDLSLIHILLLYGQAGLLQHKIIGYYDTRFRIDTVSRFTGLFL